MRAALLTLALTTAAAAQQAPSFARDIAPILERRCAGCHAAQVKMAGFVTDTYDDLVKGGVHGTAIVPGKSGESRLLKLLTGELKPTMPMDGTTLAKGEIELFVRWIDAGAKPPTPEESAAMRKTRTQQAAPDIQPKTAVRPSVYAMAWNPNGTHVALAQFKTVTLADARTGKPISKLEGHAETVRAIAISNDGRLLAAAGGIPGKRGEVKLWDLARREAILTFNGHDDCIYAAAFSPDGKLLATSSYDKLIKLWDTATGKEIRTLKDHIDAVYALAFTPDGRRLVSGSADRSVKVWNPATGERLYTMSEAIDGINSVVVSPDGKLVAAGGLDKSVRVWEIGEKEPKLLNSLMAHEDAILKLAWSPDGKTIASTAADRTIKLLRAADLTELKLIPGQPDWVYSLAFSPDGRTIAAGRFDGSLSLYDAATYRDTLETVRAEVR
ncbi:MAG TPA: c-type cytochrome domain-containing protein [Bryobacteraceae bacterium]|nr:c-type cytochrome domain-containing protein [Bryobacteraceae bacterium]